MRKTLPISKIVAPINAVIPPASSISPENSVEGFSRGSQTKNALMTQTTDPIVKIAATR
ncbi:hypothetical protein CJF30_00007292 [Rutstroemia sp. NJR-2017a BBW]|nr:hypothetical protein CJF30_00007292 [Rutstroemia sp. NJR-2017a BBW]